MWSRLKERKKELGLSNKDIAENTGVSERTVIRIFSEEEKDQKRGHAPSTIMPIAHFLGLTLDDVFEDSNVLFGGKTFVEMQAKLDAVIAERDSLSAQNKILEEKKASFEKDVELLKLELMYTKKLLAVHEYYTKLEVE